MRRVPVILVVVGALLAPSTAAAAQGDCAVRDARDMLRTAGQGMNGRVLEVHDDRIVVMAESRHDTESIAFEEHVTIHGRALPAILQNRIGIVVRRRDGRWTATRCDVIPGWRMANALSGLPPCPAPKVRIQRLRITGRDARMTLRFTGDITGLRVDWGAVVVRKTLEPGFTSTTLDRRFGRAGRRVIVVRVTGAAGPGCGTTKARRAKARRTITIR